MKHSMNYQRNTMTNSAVNKNHALSLSGAVFGFAIAMMLLCREATAVQALVPLGSAAKFAILAATTVTSTGATKVNGHLGVSPGTAVTGSLKVSGIIHAGGPTAAKAQSDLTSAYNDAVKRTAGALTVGGNLGGLTLTPGLYKSTASLDISSGDLTLEAKVATH